jgi:hypothetical protein
VFRSKTVFVVGAGASREAGLPTGAELKRIIASKLDIRYRYGYELTSGNQEIADALKEQARQNGQDPNLFLHEARKIADAMPQAISIDNFIDAHQGNVTLEVCGKLSIAHSILEAENNRKIYSNPFEQRRFEPQNLSDTWYENFFKILTEGVRIENLQPIFDDISFVIFDYDRCIEQFLYCSLQNFYGIADQDTAELLARLKISHPYGSVGQLPWQNGGRALPLVPSPGVRISSRSAGKLRHSRRGQRITQAEMRYDHN